MAKKTYPEDDLQMAVGRYLDFQNVLWCHVANERGTTLRAGRRLKNKGVKSGVPDCLIFEPRNDFNGLAIELKIKPNKPTENQIKWLGKLQKNGWLTAICYNFDEAKTVIDSYLK